MEKNDYDVDKNKADGKRNTKKPGADIRKD